MIAYQQLTLQQVYDEIVARLGKHRTEENTDWGTMVNFINHARNEVMMFTMPFKDWAYTTSMNVTHLQQLPPDYLSTIRVLLSSDGNPPYVEARKVDAREWFTMQNIDVKQRWNQSTRNNPIYMVWGQILYLHPSTTWGDFAAPIFSGIMDCYMIPPKVTTPGGILRVAFEFEEFMIYSALERMLLKTGEQQLLVSVHEALKNERDKVIEKYVKQRHTSKRELESFVEPITPLVPPAPEAGELPMRLA